MAAPAGKRGSSPISGGDANVSARFPSHMYLRWRSCWLTVDRSSDRLTPCPPTSLEADARAPCPEIRYVSISSIANCSVLRLSDVCFRFAIAECEPVALGGSWRRPPKGEPDRLPKLRGYQADAPRRLVWGPREILVRNRWSSWVSVEVRPAPDERRMMRSGSNDLHQTAAAQGQVARFGHRLPLPEVEYVQRQTFQRQTTCL